MLDSCAKHGSYGYYTFYEISSWSLGKRRQEHLDYENMKSAVRSSNAIAANEHIRNIDNIVSNATSSELYAMSEDSSLPEDLRNAASSERNRRL